MINETDYSNNPLTKEQENKIDSMFAEYDNTDSPGFAIGVIKEGSFIYKKSLGMANLDYQIPVSSNTSFHMGSVTKQFTAACVALLILDGKLGVNDDIRKYLPDMPDYGHIINIGNLIHHTSGIRDSCMLTMLGRFMGGEFIFDDIVTDLIYRQNKICFLPGDKYSYSNSNYQLLTKIVENVSGVTIAEFAKERLFKPLGMDNTLFADNCYKIRKNRANGYFLMNSDEYKYCPGSKKGEYLVLHHINQNVGETNLVTTMNDLLKWTNNFMYATLGRDFVDLMLTKGKLNNGEEIDYAFGNNIIIYKGHKCICHAGETTGFYASILHLPDKKLSVILLQNCIDLYNSKRKIQDVFLDVIDEEPVLEDIKKTEKDNSGLSKFDLGKYCGRYYSYELNVFYEIKLIKEKLTILLNDKFNDALEIHEEGVLTFNYGWQVYLDFNKSCSENTDSFLLYADGHGGGLRDIEFVRTNLGLRKI